MEKVLIINIITLHSQYMHIQKLYPMQQKSHKLRNNCISTYNILTLYFYYFTFVLFIDLYEKVQSPAPSPALLWTLLALACPCYLSDMFKNFSLRRTKESKSHGNFYFTLICLNTGMNLALSYYWRSEAIICFHKNKSNFLSLFDNITCGRHSALDIAILNEDKMFFCWSAYKSLSYSYVDQWLMLLMKSLKLVSRGGIPALIFSSDPLLFFLKYMKRLFCLFNSFQIKRIWII